MSGKREDLRLRLDQMKFGCIALLGGWVLFFAGFNGICALAEPVTFDPLSLDRHDVNPDPFGPVAERHPWKNTDQDSIPLLLNGPTPEAILRTLDLPLDEIKDAQKQEELSYAISRRLEGRKNCQMHTLLAKLRSRRIFARLRMGEVRGEETNFAVRSC